MGTMFIDVKKVSSEKKRADDGSRVKNPQTREAVQDIKYKVQTETIRVDEIRSVRPWNKDMNQEAQFDGKLTQIYFKGNGSKEKPPTMLISESHEDFSKRLDSVQVDE